MYFLDFFKILEIKECILHIRVMQHNKVELNVSAYALFEYVDLLFNTNFIYLYAPEYWWQKTSWFSMFITCLLFQLSRNLQILWNEHLNLNLEWNYVREGPSCWNASSPSLVLVFVMYLNTFVLQNFLLRVLIMTQ